MSSRTPDAANAAWLILVFLGLLLLTVQPAAGQSALNQTSSATSTHSTNGISFDFESAAVATLVLFLLGLTAVLLILARHVSRAGTL